MEHKNNDSKDHENNKEQVIIVNGREKDWNNKEISFEEIVILAFGSHQENNRTCYTVTYTRGNNSKPQGSMVIGDTIHIKHKMIFNVTATDKS